MAKKVPRSAFETVRAEVVMRLEDAIADVRRLRESEFKHDDSWGPYMQRFSCITSTIHEAETTLRKISPYKHDHADSSIDPALPAIATKKLLAIEHKPSIPGLY